MTFIQGILNKKEGKSGRKWRDRREGKTKEGNYTFIKLSTNGVLCSIYVVTDVALIRYNRVPKKRNKNKNQGP